MDLDIGTELANSGRAIRDKARVMLRPSARRPFAGGTMDLPPSGQGAPFMVRAFFG